MEAKLRHKAELYDGYAVTRENALRKWAYTEPKRRTEWLIDTLMAISPTRLVEVGCGAGLLAQAWMSGNNPYVGVDISLGMLRLTRETAPQAVLVRAAAERLPFADKSVECIVADCTVQACAVPEAAMKEITRVARSWLVASWVARERVGAMMERVMRESGFYITEYHTYRRWPNPGTYMYYQVYVGERKDAS